jgi:hypothetical protein
MNSIRTPQWSKTSASDRWMAGRRQESPPHFSAGKWDGPIPIQAQPVAPQQVEHRKPSKSSHNVQFFVLGCNLSARSAGLYPFPLTGCLIPACGKESRPRACHIVDFLAFFVTSAERKLARRLHLTRAGPERFWIPSTRTPYASAFKVLRNCDSHAVLADFSRALSCHLPAMRSRRADRTLENRLGRGAAARVRNGFGMGRGAPTGTVAGLEAMRLSSKACAHLAASLTRRSLCRNRKPTIANQ